MSNTDNSYLFECYIRNRKKEMISAEPRLKQFKSTINKILLWEK